MRELGREHRWASRRALVDRRVGGGPLLMSENAERSLRVAADDDLMSTVKTESTDRARGGREMSGACSQHLVLVHGIEHTPGAPPGASKLLPEEHAVMRVRIVRWFVCSPVVRYLAAGRLGSCLAACGAGTVAERERAPPGAFRCAYHQTRAMRVWESGDGRESRRGLHGPAQGGSPGHRLPDI